MIEKDIKRKKFKCQLNDIAEILFNEQFGFWDKYYAKNK